MVLESQHFPQSVGLSQQWGQMFWSESLQLWKSNKKRGVKQKMDFPRADIFFHLWRIIIAYNF